MDGGQTAAELLVGRRQPAPVLDPAEGEEPGRPWLVGDRQNGGHGKGARLGQPLQAPRLAAIGVGCGVLRRLDKDPHPAGEVGRVRLVQVPAGDPAQADDRRPERNGEIVSERHAAGRAGRRRRRRSGL